MSLQVASHPIECCKKYFVAYERFLSFCLIMRVTVDPEALSAALYFCIYILSHQLLVVDVSKCWQTCWFILFNIDTPLVDVLLTAQKKGTSLNVNVLQSIMVNSATDLDLIPLYSILQCYNDNKAAHVFTAQRSAQELPAVERQDLDQCSVLGGQQMVLTGQNFTSDSKVIFSEKTQGEEYFFLITNVCLWWNESSKVFFESYCRRATQRLYWQFVKGRCGPCATLHIVC